MNINAIIEKMHEWDIDVSDEINLLNAAVGGGKSSVLAAGMQDSGVMDLLAAFGFDGMFANGAFVPFPVRVTYGEELCITAAAVGNEKLKFFSEADFRKKFEQTGGEGWTECTAEIPNLLLRERDFYFLMLSDVSDKSFSETAPRCSGYIIVTKCDAGAPDMYTNKMAKWIAKVRKASEVTFLILNHIENGNPNLMLRLSYAGKLGDSWKDMSKQRTFKCSFKMEKYSPQTVFSNISNILIDTAITAEADAAAVKDCVKAAAKRLAAYGSGLDGKRSKLNKKAERLETLSKQFKAFCEEQIVSSLSNILDDDEKKLLRSEINGMIGELDKNIGDMTDEVYDSYKQAENSENKPAWSLKDELYLVGDYINDLCNSYTFFLMDQIKEKYIKTKMQEIFEEAKKQFFSSENGAKINGAQEKEAYLNIANEGIDLLDFNMTVANLFSMAYRGLGRFLLMSGDLTGMALGAVMSALQKQFNAAMANLANAMVHNAMPNKMYVSMLKKKMKEQITGVLPDLLYDQLINSLIPKVEDDIKIIYRDAADGICGQLTQQAKTEKNEAAQLEEKQKLIKTQYADILALIEE